VRSASARPMSTATLSTAWGGSYVNDFIDRGRVKRVYVQGDALIARRRRIIGAWFVRNSTGTMTPFSAFAQHELDAGAADTLIRFQGISFELPGPAGAGRSSGDAMEAHWRNSPRRSRAPPSPGRASPIRSGCPVGRRPCSTRMSLLVVFLCLAALYESWSIPVAVMLVIPLGLVGAVLRGDAARAAERRLSPDRPAHDDGALGQERDPDRRVRRAGGEAGHERVIEPRSRRRASVCARS
jgi:multidrug efflux pump subunit AcrB